MYYLVGDKTAEFFTSEQKWINWIHHNKEKYPDQIEIKHVNADGSVLAYIPITWIKIRPKIEKIYTDEERYALSARLGKSRRKHTACRECLTRERGSPNDTRKVKSNQNLVRAVRMQYGC